MVAELALPSGDYLHLTFDASAEPYGSLPGTMATGSTSASGTTSDVVKDNYIPIFSCRPTDYRDWRARITLYWKKMELQKRQQGAAIDLLASLQGSAWKQVEHLTETVTEDKEGGFMKVLAVLDAAFRYDDRVEQPKTFERFFYNLSRRNEQTLLSYCSDHREALREVEKHGVKLSDNVIGWLLLRRSGLSAEQRQLVLSQVDGT